MVKIIKKLWFKNKGCKVHLIVVLWQFRRSTEHLYIIQIAFMCLSIYFILRYEMNNYAVFSMDILCCNCYGKTTFPSP